MTVKTIKDVLQIVLDKLYVIMCAMGMHYVGEMQNVHQKIINLFAHANLVIMVILNLGVRELNVNQIMIAQMTKCVKILCVKYLALLTIHVVRMLYAQLKVTNRSATVNLATQVTPIRAALLLTIVKKIRVVMGQLVLMLEVHTNASVQSVLSVIHTKKDVAHQ